MNNTEGMDTITQFLRCVGMIIPDGEEGLFRGHADVRWELKPSAFRPGAAGITDYEKLAKWKNVAGRFATPRPVDELEWLVLAQHFGVPTPLLDWTTNPLVALYFACASTDSAWPGVVRLAPQSSFERMNHTLMVDIFKADRTIPALIDSTSMNARSSAQDSMMTLHSPECSYSSSPEHIGFFQVASSSKPLVRAALRRFGISSERVFADLPTAAREFAEGLVTQRTPESAVSESYLPNSLPATA